MHYYIISNGPLHVVLFTGRRLPLLSRGHRPGVHVGFAQKSKSSEHLRRAHTLLSYIPCHRSSGGRDGTGIELLFAFLHPSPYAVCNMTRNRHMVECSSPHSAGKGNLWCSCGHGVPGHLSTVLGLHMPAASRCDRWENMKSRPPPSRQRQAGVWGLLI